MNRRELLKGLMAGGIIVAGELWIPGQRLISIASGQVYAGSTFKLVDDNIIRYIGPEYETVKTEELFAWIRKYAKHMLNGQWDAKHTKIQVPSVVSLKGGCVFENPEHLTDGAFSQDSTNEQFTHEPMRELWTCDGDMDDGSLLVDKIYLGPDSTPRDRITTLDNGYVGYR